MIISASTSLTTWFEGIARLPNETLPQQSPKKKKPDNTWNTFLARVNGYYIVIYSTYPYNTRNLQENLTSIRPGARHQNLVFVEELVGWNLPFHWLFMSKSEAGLITHSRTRRDLGKRGGSCTWYICVLFHRWEEWWMDEVYRHCNGTPVHHGRGGKEEGVCLKK